MTRTDALCALLRTRSEEWTFDAYEATHVSDVRVWIANGWRHVCVYTSELGFSKEEWLWRPSFLGKLRIYAAFKVAQERRARAGKFDEAIARRAAEHDIDRRLRETGICDADGQLVKGKLHA